MLPLENPRVSVCTLLREDYEPVLRSDVRWGQVKTAFWAPEEWVAQMGKRLSGVLGLAFQGSHVSSVSPVCLLSPVLCDPNYWFGRGIDPLAMCLDRKLSRADLTEYLSRHYKAPRMVLAAAGGE